MDEVYTCICGCQTWIVRQGMVTCTKCNKDYHTHYEGRHDSWMTPKDFNKHIKTMEGM